MTTEQQPEQINPSEKESKKDKAERQPRSRRLAYKSVLTAVVVGIVVVSALSLSKIQRQERPLDELQIQDSNTPTREVIKTPVLEVGAAEDKVEQIDQRLTSLSGRIDRGFEAQVAHSSEVKKSLVSMAEGVHAIKLAVAELTESNHALRQRIDESIARLNSLIKETQKRKVAQNKPVARPKPAPAKAPPFHVDAIDVWDDMTYVAISR
ncbi:MAG: hypothetical protein B0D96_12300 [Candidatus Sedimenticola endophacoides]|nr:MAG: hypothetical protein B0D96_12300 [Candidatus Sedimenticola endophacoides]OQX49036.1 MAG: hypothetical protein B0D87_02545 [Candidatus Sedimenticola endophacoides]